MSCAAFLTVLGGVLEIGGIFLIATEIRDTELLAQELIREKRIKLGAAVALSGGGRLSVSVPLDETLPERVDRLESRIKENEERFDEGLENLKLALLKDIASAEAEAAKDARQRDENLRKLFSEKLGAGIGKRKLGVLLFLSGALLSVLGNVI